MSISEQLKGVKIDLSALDELYEHDGNAAKKAHERLDYLEDLSQCKYSQEYRDGFVQGYAEASWEAR